MAMRRPARLVLGALVTFALGASAAGWLLTRVEPVIAAEEVLPLPPGPPLLVDSPESARCFALLREDPEGARDFAARWADAGGAEGARHCAALALLELDAPAEAARLLEALARDSVADAAPRAAVLAQAVQAWLIAGEPARAVAAAGAALALRPEEPDLLQDRAAALGLLGRHAESIADLDRVLAIAPARADALVLRAAALRQLDRQEAARRDIERALALEPLHVEALLERGILRQLAGDTEGARMDWERAIELAPASVAADLATQNLALSEFGPVPR
jgi:tetratricopeptide (TPR) repeat protein